MKANLFTIAPITACLLSSIVYAGNENLTAEKKQLCDSTYKIMVELTEKRLKVMPAGKRKKRIMESMARAKKQGPAICYKFKIDVKALKERKTVLLKQLESFKKKREEVDRLVGLLKTDSDLVKLQTIQRLRGLRDIRAVGPLTKLLNDKNVEVRLKVIKALKVLNDKKSVLPLIATLKSKEVKIRRESASVLGELGDSRAIAPLVTALKDNDNDVRFYAAHSLMKFKDPRITDAFLKHLDADANDKLSIRNLAATGLGYSESPKVVAPLIRVLKTDKDPVLRGIIVRSLGLLYGEHKTPAALNAILYALKSSHIKDREAAVWALFELRHPKAVAPLKSAIRKEEKLMQQNKDSSKKGENARLIKLMNEILAKTAKKKAA